MPEATPATPASAAGSSASPVVAQHLVRFTRRRGDANRGCWRRLWCIPLWKNRGRWQQALKEQLAALQANFNEKTDLVFQALGIKQDVWLNGRNEKRSSWGD
jgi:hypothetical protein